MTAKVLGLSLLLAFGLAVDMPVARAGDEPTPSAREEMEVAAVLGTGEGQYVVVLRTQTEPHRYLPIWIGEIEALNIRIRLERQQPPRPLTLNLLESVLQSGEIQLSEVAIDDLRGGVFLGRLQLRQKGRIWNVDARPSDAIGLAVGRDAPIWVTNKVLNSAAVDADALDRAESSPETGATSLDETL